jgi:CRISPR/Cas system-associated exonuclease Cas4 (RecB family)
MKVWETQPEFIDTLLQNLKEHFKLLHQREGIHLTDCLLCLRKAYWDKVDALPPTEDELLYFILGLGLQEVLHLASTVGETEMKLDGILLNPDFETVKGTPVELKTTRIGRKRLDSHDFPQHWIKQLMGYCYGLKVTEGELLIFTLIHPELLNYHIEFTSRELGENWGMVLGNVEILKIALSTHTLPTRTSEDWLCKDCRYRLRCMIEEKK